MTTDRTLLQQALEALTVYDGENGASKRKRVLAALRARLAEPEPERMGLGAIREAIEERDAMERQYHDLAESLIYRGNSVSWWYSKATAYREAIDRVWEALRAAGISSDGKKTCADGVRELASRLAEPEPEPIAWMVTNMDGQDCYVTADPTLAQAGQVALPLYTGPVAERPCTCHPDDKPPVPCAKQYALMECREFGSRVQRVMEAADEYAQAMCYPISADVDLDAARAELERVVRECVR